MLSFPGKHALIIEDDPNGVIVLEQNLHRLAIESSHIASTDDIIGVIQSLPDLAIVFVDLEMPGLNGYDVLAVLQDHAITDYVPVVAYTTHINQVNTAREAGFHSFISKPVRRADFPSHIQRIFWGEHVWDIG